jgi:hypothetical protein
MPRGIHFSARRAAELVPIAVTEFPRSAPFRPMPSSTAVGWMLTRDVQAVISGMKQSDQQKGQLGQNRRLLLIGGEC